MPIPLEIVFEDFPPSLTIENAIAKEARALERLSAHILRCRVAVRKPHKHNHKGAEYDIHIHLTLPNRREIVVSRAPGKPARREVANAAVRDAFKAAKRQLEDAMRMMRRQIKTHEEGFQQGRILRLHRPEGYGIIERGDGMELYFHRNAAESPDFEALEEGMEVQYREKEGDNGPHAITVRRRMPVKLD